MPAVDLSCSRRPVRLDPGGQYLTTASLRWSYWLNAVCLVGLLPALAQRWQPQGVCQTVEYGTEPVCAPLYYTPGRRSQPLPAIVAATRSRLLIFRPSCRRCDILSAVSVLRTTHQITQMPVRNISSMARYCVHTGKHTQDFCVP